MGQNLLPLVLGENALKTGRRTFATRIARPFDQAVRVAHQRAGMSHRFVERADHLDIVTGTGIERGDKGRRKAPLRDCRETGTS